MELESRSFTRDDIAAFMAGYREHERDLLVERLERVSLRMEGVAARMASASPPSTGWDAHEILAHIAVVSKFYGVVTHRIAGGKVDEMDLLESVQLRDVAGKQMAEQADADLVRSAIADQRRTAGMLRSIDASALGRSARVNGDVSMTAEEVARMPLVAHLEMHLDQLEALLA